MKPIKNIKHKFTLTIVLIFMLILSSQSLAQTGCFLHKESPFYCSDLSLEEATKECELYSGCDLDAYYYSQESCTNKEIFPECELILCKDDCQQQVRGKCLSGKLFIEEKDQWCNPGCCYFEYYQNDYCGYEASKSVCETEAINKDANKFSFDSNKNEAICLNFCSQKEYADIDVYFNLAFEEIDKSEDLISFDQLVEQYPLESEELEELEESKKDSNILFKFLLIIAFVIAILFLIFYFGLKPIKINQTKNLLNVILKWFKNFFSISKKRKESSSLRNIKKILFPLEGNPQIKKEILNKSKTRKRKLNELQHLKLFNEFGHTKENVGKKEIVELYKLKKLVSSYERKLKYHPKEITPQEASTVKKLEQALGLKPNKSVKEEINITHLEKNPTLLNKIIKKDNRLTEKDTIFELKKIANRRK